MPQEPLPPGPIAASIELSMNAVTLIVDSVVQLSAVVLDDEGDTILSPELEWTSSDPGIASASSGGTVQAIAPGQAFIRASVGGARDTAAITVVQGASVIISPSDVGRIPGDTARLLAIVLDHEGKAIVRPITWVSSNSEVVTVSSNGLIGAEAPGSAVVSAHAEGAVGSVPVDVTLNRYQAVSSADLHSCAIDLDQAVWCWGRGASGRLGDGLGQSRAVPVRVAGGHRFSSISAGGEQSCGVTLEAAVLCWGVNSDGQLGNDSITSSLLPVHVAGLPPMASVATGTRHTCGVSEAAPTFCWGRGTVGQLGNGAFDSSPSPVQVTGNHQFKTVSAGYKHTCGVTTGGQGFCWGSNGHSQLGNGESAGLHAEPVQVVFGLGLSSIQATQHSWSCAVAVNETIYCWGHNDFGQLGRGTRSSEEAEILPVIDAPSATMVEGHFLHTCGLAVDGTAYCWGHGSSGQLGNGETQDRETAVPVTGGHLFSEVTVGQDFTCALSDEGLVYCWGLNGFGVTLGSGSFEMFNAAEPGLVAGQ